MMDDAIALTAHSANAVYIYEYVVIYLLSRFYNKAVSRKSQEID